MLFVIFPKFRKSKWKDFHKAYTVLLKGIGTSSIYKDVSVSLMDSWHFMPPTKIDRISYK